MVINLTTKEFKEKIFDYEKEKEWKFKGNKPAIIDYFAEWCSPCKTIAPILEELSEEYKNKIDIYKVNVEESHELSKTFAIQSIPAILFIPLKDEPQMMVGGLPKESFKQTINDLFKIK